MMQHKTLEAGRWAELPLDEQMGNIGSEVSRTLSWMRKGEPARAGEAFARSLELIDLTIRYGRLGLSGRSALLEEMCRLREVYCAAYLSGDPEQVAPYDRYFYHFALAAQMRKYRSGLQGV